MKKPNEIKFTPEVLEKIEECKNAEELVKLASEKAVELSPEELEGVVGGINGITNPGSQQGIEGHYEPVYG